MGTFDGIYIVRPMYSCIQVIQTEQVIQVKNTVSRHLNTLTRDVFSTLYDDFFLFRALL